MTRLWTAPAVVGVLAAVLTVWLVRAVGVLLGEGPGSAVVTVPSLWLLYAAGPAVLSAVPLVLLARAALSRLGRSVGVYAMLGLLGGAVVGVVQTGVLLASWPWELTSGLAWDLVGLPAVGGVVGGTVAGVVARRPSTRPVAHDAGPAVPDR